MSVSVVMTSSGGWDEYVKPAVDSIREHEDIPIIYVDAGHKAPDYELCKTIHTDLISFTEAVNVALETINTDWVIVIDTDVICQDEFSHIFYNWLLDDTIYGNKIIPAGRYFDHPDYLDGWILAISKRVLDDVGLFDENIVASGFEDADYCIRALNKGYNVVQYDFPFYHLTAGQKRDITKDYDEKRLQNIAYVKKKWGL